jgi:mono/diheme cytochrome c family protein
MAVVPSIRPEKAPWWNPGKYFAVRRKTPIELRSYTNIYAILSIFLFIFTLWAVMDEVLTRRPWKGIQEDFKQFKITRLNLEIKKELHKLNPADTQTIHKEIKSLQKEMGSDAYKAKLSKIEDYDKKIVTAQRDYTFTKSLADEKYYVLDEARTEHADTTGKSKNLRELEKTMAVQQRVVDSLQKLRADVQAQVVPTERRLKEVEHTHDSVFAQVIVLKRKREAAEQMNIAVRQTMLVNYEKTNFNNLKMRVDRCVTCHLGFDDELFKNDTLVSTDASQIKAWTKSNKYNDKDHYSLVKLGPNKDTVVAKVTTVFSMHPNINLLIKGHKVGEPSGNGVLGCTSCHGGQGGSLVSTEFAHGFEHHWTEPLTTGHYVETSCRNCHAGKMDFEGAKYISMGKKLFTDFGCYGCHNSPGTDGLPQQAPSLRNITKKVTPQWMYQWISNPRGWSHNTRMPNFMFNQHEVTAVVAYLNDQAKTGTYQPIAQSAGGGDAMRGKQVFGDVGCFGCHAVDDYKTDSRVKEANSFGPDLNKIGSKVTAAWMFDWIKNPKNYHMESRMPSLRLSDDEAKDLTAYLMQHTGTNDSVSSSMTEDINSPTLIKEGDKLIRSYGCFGCHEIKGMEGEAKVSVSLNTFGKKTPGELFYGNVPGDVLGHFRSEFKKHGLPLAKVDEEAIHENQDWYTWVVGKMKNSRMYQTERISQKMPNFQMSEEEAYALTVLLKGFTGQYISQSYADNTDDPNQRGLDQGRLFAHWNNCVGCHQIENAGGYVGQYIQDAMFRPPLLTPEGNKVQELWLRNFLKGPTPIRPWLKIRMPTFGFSDSSITVATRYFLATKERPFVLTDYQFVADQNLLGAGKELFDQLKCLSCHVVGTGGAQQIAPNLELTKHRLRPDWVIDWLHNPEAQQPGTRMPAFWGTPSKGMTSLYPAILGGDVEMQIRAVRDYVYSIGMDNLTPPSAYATINGKDHYVYPNGRYDIFLTNGTIVNDNQLPTPATKPGAAGTPTAPAKSDTKHASRLPHSGKPTAMR